MSPLHRGEAHRRAAAILHEQGASDEAIAAHLLVAPPASDSARSRGASVGGAQGDRQRRRRERRADAAAGACRAAGGRALSGSARRARRGRAVGWAATGQRAHRGRDRSDRRPRSPRTAFAGARQSALLRRPLPRRRRDAGRVDEGDQRRRSGAGGRAGGGLHGRGVTGPRARRGRSAAGRAPAPEGGASPRPAPSAPRSRTSQCRPRCADRIAPRSRALPTSPGATARCSTTTPRTASAGRC